MNKKILLSLSVIGAVAAIAVGGTIAYFSDTETSTGNTFMAGTLDLNIDSANSDVKMFEVGGVGPGSNGNNEVLLKNVGTINGYLDITFSSLINDENGCIEPEEETGTQCNSVADGVGLGELAASLHILAYIDEDSSGTYAIGTDTLVYSGMADAIVAEQLSNYALDNGVEKPFRIEWNVDTAAGNNIQSDKAGFDITFELAQTTD